MSAHVLAHLLEHRYRVANTLITDPLHSRRQNIHEVLRDELGQRVGAVLSEDKVAILP
jgi:hypothetical protein